ncbi:MAG: subclass B1 metallo-beta-lactamase [Breznakibacter sp.]
MRIFLTMVLCWATGLTMARQPDTIRISPDLELVKLTDNVYQHISYANVPRYGRVPANGLVCISNQKALLIDTPWNNELTKQLHQYLTSMGIDLDHAVVTHWHEDCMGGLGYLQQHFILSTSGERTYETARKKNLPVAFIRFRDTLDFNFQAVPVKCFYPGAGHTDDNIVVYLPSEKILFGGCLIKEAASASLGNLADADVRSWPLSLEKIRQKFSAATVVVPGHGATGTLLLIDHTLELLDKR